MTHQLNELRKVLEKLHDLLASEVLGEDLRIYNLAEDFEEAVNNLPPEQYELLRWTIDHVRKFLFVQTHTPVNVENALSQGVDTLLLDLKSGRR